MKTDAQSGPTSRVPLALIAVGVLLSCIYGGYIVNDQTHLPSGFASLIVNVFGGSDAPLFAHAMLGLPIIAGLTFNLVSRRIQQVPGQLFTSIWLLFFLFLGASIVFSSFRALSLDLWLEWLVYGCALFAVVACTGRTRGPTLILGAIAVGCSVLALKGIMEYGGMRSTDPSWRVFAGWVNPNATAAMLLIGFFVSMGLCLGRGRNQALLAGMGAALMAFAIFLTGSKGGVALGLPLGTIVLGASLTRAKGGAAIAMLVGCLLASGAVGILFLKNGGWFGLAFSTLFAITLVLIFGVPQIRKVQATRLFACYAGAFVLVSLLSLTVSAKPAPAAASGTQPVAAAPATPISRIGEGNQTQDQSSTFRINLWKSAVNLIKERPLTGYGMGTYRYESGRAGITTTTIFAHNSYLQLWAECGIVPTVLFLAGILLWLWLMLRNHARVPEASMGPAAGLLAAVLALLAHALVDSDLSYFGIGLVFFVLLGLGLLINVDAVAPEFIPKPARYLAAAGLSGLAVVLCVVAAAENAKSEFNFDLHGSDRSALEADGQALDWVATFDGEAAYFQALLKNGTDRVDLLRHAYDLNPSEKIARALATALVGVNKPMDAVSTLKEALFRDPDNLTTLTTLMTIQVNSQDKDGAVETARRIVAVEDTPYFKVRSIPESIQTETYQARFEVLAPNEQDPRQRADIIKAAVKGMLAYGSSTAQIIFHDSDDGKEPDADVPGYDTLTTARKKLSEAADQARTASKLYREVGDGAAAAEMETAGRTLDGDLAAVSSK